MNTTLRRYLTDGQQSQLLAYVKTHAAVLARRDFAWIRLLRDTGMRVGEFSKMSIGAALFALETNWIYIPKENRKGHKNKKTGEVVRHAHRFPIDRHARQALQLLVDIHFEMGGSGEPDKPLVLSRKGNGAQPLSVRSYQVRIARWCLDAGIEAASPHWMRHTRAMNIMKNSQAKDPRGVVQALLGHETIASTGVYTGITKEDLLEAVATAAGPEKVRGRGVAKAYQQRVAG